MTVRRGGAVVVAIVAIGIVVAIAVVVGIWLAARQHELPPDPLVAPAAPQARTEPVRPRVRAEPVEPATADAHAAPATETGGLLRGHCVFADGTPAPGARVRAWSVGRLWNGEEGRLGEEARSGDDGRFEISGIETGGQVVVYGVLPGCQTAGAVPKIETLPAEVTLTFGLGGVLTGTVRDAAGTALADAEVRLCPTDRAAHSRDSGDWRVWTDRSIWDFYVATARTDAAGRYRFAGVPLPRNGRTEPRAAVVRDAEGHAWRSDEAAFETHGQELVRDVRVGERRFDETFAEAGPSKPVRVRAKGRVLGPDGAPIAGARVTYVETKGRGSTSWFGTTTKADGSFEFEERMVTPKHRLDVRVRTAGFRPWRGAPPRDSAAETVVHLVPADHAPQPGRVRGVATSADGKALTGAIEVTAIDEMYGVHGMWTWAGGDGSFVLEGVPSGDWQFFLSWDDAWQEAAVPEGGETRIALDSERDLAWFAPGPWTEEKEKQRDAARERVQELSALREAARRAGRPDDEVETRLIESHRLVDELDAAWRASLPAREVVVDGLPKTGVVIVRAHDGSRTWRAEAKAGVARFAALSVETWTLTLERPGLGDAEQEFEVVAGEGPQTLSWREK